jgi:hypothetical protein
MVLGFGLAEPDLPAIRVLVRHAINMCHVSG